MLADIYKELYRWFAKHEYRLSNSFVYEWESDFFAMSKSRYFIEVEVKVSRGDFFRDFDKPKHRLFQDIRAGKQFHITHHPTRGDVICRVETGRLISYYGECARVNGGDGNWRYARRNDKWGYWVNDYGPCSIRKHEEVFYAPATYIRFREIEKIHCPNLFYYACPEGLIRIDEIPEYAGLLYHTGERLVEIKKAPYLHKRKQDLDKVLLRKFYNLWNYKVATEQKIVINNENRESSLQPGAGETS